MDSRLYLTTLAGLCRYQFHPKPSPPRDTAKYPPPGTITVHKNPPIGTKQGVKSRHSWDIKLENFTNVPINSDTISNEKLGGLNK